MKNAKVLLVEVSKLLTGNHSLVVLDDNLILVIERPDKKYNVTIHDDKANPSLLAQQVAAGIRNLEKAVSTPFTIENATQGIVEPAQPIRSQAEPLKDIFDY